MQRADYIDEAVRLAACVRGDVSADLTRALERLARGAFPDDTGDMIEAQREVRGCATALAHLDMGIRELERGVR